MKSESIEISRPARRKDFVRAALLAGTLAAVFIPTISRAQETQNEESERRASVLEKLPPNAAKRLFGTVSGAAPMAARSIGSYALGCLAGGRALPVDGEAWQVMRLSRNRMWGHPDLINFLERFAKRVQTETGWPGILVGDISQPRGGPMLTGHASHQVGLDADLWLTPMPDRKLSRQERENISATNMVRADWMDVDERVWTPQHVLAIRLAAMEPGVARIFVNPALKKGLCEAAGNDRAWLGKVRPMWGHNYHFHVRMSCRAGSEDCEDQAAPPGGDGCGRELTDWLALQHKAIFGPKKKSRPGKPKPPMTLDNLPEPCREVLVAR